MSAANYPNIVLIGKAGAGKDTVAGILADLAGYQRFALADPLKDIAAAVWGAEARTDRGKLQGLGSAVRGVDPDAWLNLLLRRINDAQGDVALGCGVIVPCSARIVVTDCRFTNELDALRDRGYVVVRVIAGRGERVSRLRMNGKLQDEAQLDHHGETELDGVHADHAILNETTPHALIGEVAALLNRLAT